jgi:hypothetical protein
MTEANFDVLRRALKPVPSERLAEIMRERVGSGEQLTLADAGLEDEVRELLAGRAGAVAGYQAKVLLRGEQGDLELDGAERSNDTWRPVAVEPAQAVMDALDEALSKLEPTSSALQVLLNEMLR